MVVAPIPSRESARLDALHRCHILDTPSESAFDELAQLAAYVCRTPMAVISLVDATRQWFKSVVGLPFTESPRSIAFCAHTILGTDLFIVEEADADHRFDDHPWVVESPSIRFYAGVPLITPDGHAIGSLAVMDVVPRTLTPEQCTGMHMLAKQVMAQLELRNGREALRMPPVESKAPVACDLDLVERVCVPSGLVALNLQNIVDTIPDFLFTLDCQGRFITWNRRVAEVTGYTPEELLGKPALDFVPPEEQERTAAAIQQAFTEGYAELDGLLLTKDGRQIPYHWTGASLKDPQGELLGITGMGRDVSVQKRMGEELRHSETRLKEAQRLAQIGDWELDLRTNALLWSDEIYRIFEIDRATFQASYEGFLNLVHPDDIEMVHRAYSDSVEQRIPYDITHRLLMKDGRIKFVHERCVTHYLSDGRPARSVGTVQDITERKQAEEKRRQQELLITLMLNTGPACIKRVDKDGVLLHMNSAGLTLLEACKEEEVVGRSVFALVVPEHRDAFISMHRSVIEGHTHLFQFEIQGLSGTRRWMETYAVPFRNPITGQTEHLAVSHDITERKQTENALRDSRQKLQQALHASHTGLWDWNTETGEVVYSKEWKSQLGYDEMELPDSFETWASLLHPDDRERAILYAQAYCENPVGAFRQDFRLRHKDGSYRWVDSQASFVTEADGRKIRLLGSHTDITARKEVEQALADSQQRFSLAVDGANDALWDAHILPGESWSAPHTSIWWSPRTRLILGLEESEPFDTLAHWASRLHPDDKERVFTLLAAHLEHRVPYDVEYRLRDSQGDFRWIRARGQAIWDEQGTPRRISGSCKDVTERKTRELLIAAENDLLGMIATDASLPAILTKMCRALEACLQESLCSILLLDRNGIRLRHGAGPGLPDAYVHAIDGVAIGPAVGSCGTAAATKQRIIVPDIATDPLWEDYRELALLNGLQACWSTPILAANGAVLGTFAVYHRRPRYPNAVDLELVDRASHLVSIAIERARAEDKLRLTQFSIDHATDALYWIDQRARIVDVNQAACAMLGYSAEEFRRMTVHDINPHFPAAHWTEFWAETRRAGTASIQSEHRTKDGRLIPIEVNVQFLRYEGCEYHCAFVRDISGRKEAERALRESEERFRLVAEATNDILWDWDLLTNEHWWSPNAQEKFGYVPGEEPSVTAWMDRLHPDDRGCVLELVDRALASDARTVTAEYRFRLADGSYGHFYDRGQIVRDASGRAIRMIGAMIDVTQSKRAYAALEDAYQRLQTMSRELHAVESNERRRLSRELHDEVGQLLTGLKFDLQASRQALVDPTTAAIARARERTLRALETTDELFARLRHLVRALRPSVLEELGLKEALEALVSDVQSRSDLVCSVSIDAEGLGSLTDMTIETALYRMAQELTTNVVRHGQAMTMSILLTMDSRHWMLTVQDDGVGFDPKAESMGGMGLRGVRERAEILGGHVDISSIPGAGSTVTVWIPVAGQAPEKA